MRHIGMICPDYTGHLNSMRVLGRELQRRGYQVSLIGWPDSRGSAEAGGLGFIPIGEADFPVGSVERLGAQLGRLKGLRANRFSVTNIMLRASEVILRDAPRAIATAGIDALLVDQMRAAGGSVADKLGIPFVTVCSALAADRDLTVPPPFTGWCYDPTPFGRLRNRIGYTAADRVMKPVFDLIAARRAAWGLPPLPASDGANSTLAVIAQQPAAFDFPRANLSPVFHHTGPFLEDRRGQPGPFPFERLTGKPLIYASLGTRQNRLHSIFHVIAAACAGLDAQLVIGLGSKGQAILADLPGEPIVVPFAPQLQLLKRADAVITHAGLNTVLEALSQGVPMVAIPITNDHPGVAARIAYRGVGEVIPLHKLSAGSLRASVLRVLAPSSYRRRAAALREAIARSEGLRRAVDIAEQALCSRMPVVRQPLEQ